MGPATGSQPVESQAARRQGRGDPETGVRLSTEGIDESITKSPILQRTKEVKEEIVGVTSCGSPMYDDDSRFDLTV